MFLHLFSINCLFQFIILNVYGKREPPQRFIIEEDLKPPIFGSYSYDPVKDIFQTPPGEDDGNNKQIINGSYILSTVVGDVEPATRTTRTMVHNRSNVFFRKHVTLSTRKTTLWWERPKFPIGKATNKTIKD